MLSIHSAFYVLLFRISYSKIVLFPLHPIVDLFSCIPRRFSFVILEFPVLLHPVPVSFEFLFFCKYHFINLARLTSYFLLRSFHSVVSFILSFFSNFPFCSFFIFLLSFPIHALNFCSVVFGSIVISFPTSFSPEQICSLSSVMSVRVFSLYFIYLFGFFLHPFPILVPKGW